MQLHRPVAEHGNRLFSPRPDASEAASAEFFICGPAKKLHIAEPGQAQAAGFAACLTAGGVRLAQRRCGRIVRMSRSFGVARSQMFLDCFFVKIVRLPLDDCNGPFRTMP